MNHNYKLTDFKKMQSEDMEIDILERIVSIDLVNLTEVPEIIKNRLETLINTAIDEYEQSNDTVIQLENMEISMQVEVDTEERELFLQAYIGYRLDENCLEGKDIIDSNDKDYRIIKDYFMKKLTESVSEQMMRISMCA